jgi:hypothetical protein
MYEILLGLTIGCIIGLLIYEFTYIIISCIIACVTISAYFTVYTNNNVSGGSINPNIRSAALSGLYGSDSSGLDSSGLDSSELDSSGLDSSGLDSSGLDSSELDSSGLDVSGGSKYYRSEFPIKYFNRDNSNHKKIKQNYDKMVNKILTTSMFPKIVSHYTENTKKTDKFNRILNLTITSPYKRSINKYKPQLHWGQLKLFLSEVEFLTRATKLAKNKEITLLYIGAAPGNHIYYLSSLFPEVRFELYDLVNFNCKETDKIKIHKQFFLDADAIEWSKFIKKHPEKYITFCTDIRTRPAIPENVDADMKMQFNWWKLLNPDLAIFKFRLPWTEGKTKYPSGDIYIQLYAGPTSSESRLIVKKNAKIIEYDNITYQNAMYHHNRFVRSSIHTNFKGYALDKCYDCAGFEYIVQEYLKLGINNKSSKSLIEEIQKKVSSNKTVRALTVQHIVDELDMYYRQQHVPCGATHCNICISGINDDDMLGFRSSSSSSI